MVSSSRTVVAFHRQFPFGEHSAAFDRAVEPVFRILSRDQAVKIADFYAETVLQDRIDQLARKANERDLTLDERAEYKGHAQAHRFIAVL